MLKFIPFTDIFGFDQEYTIVNPVNCDGAMGRGLALAFAHRYGDTYLASYQRHTRGHARHLVVSRADCDGRLVPGTIQIYRVAGKPLVVNFPTKDHPYDHSQLTDIAAGLHVLRYALDHNQLSRVVLPALGCGLGGLRFTDFAQLCETYFGDLADDKTVIVIRQH